MPRRTLTAEEEATLASLHARLVITLRFIEEAEEFPSGAAMREIIKQAAARKDLRTLKRLQPDVREMTLALPAGQRAALDQRLREASLETWGDSATEARREAAAVLARGTIRSEKERRRLEAHADELAASPDGDGTSSARSSGCCRRRDSGHLLSAHRRSDPLRRARPSMVLRVLRERRVKVFLKSGFMRRDGLPCDA